jgi:cytoskeletal protein CcmA (bactofilin family)
MFGNKKTPNSDNATSLPSSSSINTIVAGTSIEGTIDTQNDIRIDGKVDGTITCSGKLIIGPEGRVDGDANCQNAVIEGHFRGNLTITDILDVRENATIIGEIKTGKLLVQNGATLNGNCDMGQRLKSMPQPNSESSAS